MTDLPYTYTEPNGDSLRMFSDGPDLVVTVRQDGGARTVVVPREETPNLARAVLAAAGDTGHEVISAKEIEWLRAENTRLTRERDVAVRELGKALTAERAEHLDVKFDGTRRRVGALEQQFTDLAALVHGHGEDLARLRCRFTEEDDG